MATDTARTAPVQRRHESPDVGDAIVRMLRGLVTRAAEGDTEAIEQLRRIERQAPRAMALGARLAHDCAGYSFTELARAMRVSRQGARQRLDLVMIGIEDHPEAHQLLPGHTRRECPLCLGEGDG